MYIVKYKKIDKNLKHKEYMVKDYDEHIRFILT